MSETVVIVENSGAVVAEVGVGGPQGPQGPPGIISVLAAASTPEAMVVGDITRDADGAAIAAAIEWPDGTAGTYTGTPSSLFPGAIDSYVLTHGAATYTQPPVTRDEDGAVITRPAIEVT